MSDSFELVSEVTVERDANFGSVAVKENFVSRTEENLQPANIVQTDAFTVDLEQQIADESEAPSRIVHDMRHEVAIPIGFETYIPISEYKRSTQPARTYPFTLDPFQQLSIDCIERGESVLVSAHTSAGKTVVAEYAIATALRDKQRVVYTSPIKALSNQKYREFGENFDGDVGLMTGDVTINPTASCLVMTTEILRSMLYRGSEVMREVAWVVFDEIHYMRDRERGVVWEETLILLPPTVRFVFLSATIPNAMQFVRWVAHIHRQPCHVVYTNYRPTPLQHFMFPSGADGIYLAVDEKGIFREENFAKALSALDSTDTTHSDVSQPVLGESHGSGRKRKRPKKSGDSQTSDINRLLKMVIGKNLAPVIVFSFAKKECEANAMQVARMDLNNEDERRMVTSIFENAIEILGEEDRNLPQIQSILPLLKNGIGIHHSGLLPIIKEVIEILFQEGLLKLLFATETFSIGLNMPARTVVFTSVRKWDGTENRWISGGEYIQMSGRAGRRGLDKRGVVILMLDESMDPGAARAMLKGATDPLNSAFHLSYNMILNLMRVGEETTPEFMLSRSFFQFQQTDSIPVMQKDVDVLLADYNAFEIPDEASIALYWNIRSQLDICKDDIRRILHHPTYVVPFLQPGRLVKVRDGLVSYGWCVVVNVIKKGGTTAPANKKGSSNTTGGSKQDDVNIRYIIDVLAFCESQRTSTNMLQKMIPKPAASESSGEMIVIPVSLATLDGVSAVRVYMPKDLRSSDQRLGVRKAVREVEKRFPDGPPILDAVEDMGIRDEAFSTLVGKTESLEATLFGHPLHRSPLLAERYDLYAKKQALLGSIENLQKTIRDTTALVHMEELKGRKRLLRRLGYTSGDTALDDPEQAHNAGSGDVVDMKGRVACEISTGDELLLTELMFAGAFGDLKPEQIAAVLSCIVFQERSSGSSTTLKSISRIEGDIQQGFNTQGSAENDAVKASLGGFRREDLDLPLRLLQETARSVARASTECGLPIDEAEYVDGLCPDLMEVVYAWCRGAKFSRICRMTEVYEGSIIRCMRRLEELLRQMAQAARSIGNAPLELKFSQSIALLKRDIVFANSLYL